MISIIGYCCIWSCCVASSQGDVLNLKQPTDQTEEQNLYISFTWHFFFVIFVMRVIRHIQWSAFLSPSFPHPLFPPSFHFLPFFWIEVLYCWLNGMKHSWYDKRTTRHKDLWYMTVSAYNSFSNCTANEAQHWCSTVQ